jgi:hypothetical protein
MKIKYSTMASALRKLFTKANQANNKAVKSLIQAFFLLAAYQGKG